MAVTLCWSHIRFSLLSGWLVWGAKHPVDYPWHSAWVCVDLLDDGFGIRIIRRFDAFVSNKQEAFEKCWAHSPLRAAARRVAIHQVLPLSHAACASMSTTTTTTTTTRDRGDRYGPIEWAQKFKNPNDFFHTWNALPDNMCTTADTVSFLKLLKYHHFCVAFNICWLFSPCFTAHLGLL